MPAPGAFLSGCPVKRFLRVCGLAGIVASLGVLGSCSALGGLNDALSDAPNVGPCPVTGSLYEANRVADIYGVERHENVGFTGAIEGVRGFCRYIGTNP